MSRCIAQGLVVLMVPALIVLCMGGQAAAFDARVGETVIVDSTEALEEDLYVAGGTIVVDGIIDGDLWACGRSITINGEVKGSVVAAAETIDIKGRCDHTVRAACRLLTISGNIAGDVIALAGELRMASEAACAGDLLFGAGEAHIDGAIGSEVLGGAKNVVMGGHVEGDVTLRARQLILSPYARIQGNLTYTSEEEAVLQSGALVAGAVVRKSPALTVKKGDAAMGHFMRIIQKVIGFLMALVTGLVIILIVPQRLGSAADAIGGSPWLSLGWGTVLLIVVPFVVLTLFFTIVGIPVALICLVLYAMMIYLSQIPVGLFIGRWIIRRFFDVESKAFMMGSLALGLFVLGLLRILPYIGFFVGLAVVLVGIGATVVAITRLWTSHQGFFGARP